MSPRLSLTDEQRPAPSRRRARTRSTRPAFERLFRECAADVHGYAISLLGDRAGAEDVTALAFERLYRSRARLDTARGTPRGWLFSIARNAALDELRRRRRQPLDAHGAEPVEVGEPSQAIEHAERRAALHGGADGAVAARARGRAAEVPRPADQRRAGARAGHQRVQRRHARASRARAPARDLRRSSPARRSHEDRSLPQA